VLVCLSPVLLDCGRCSKSSVSNYGDYTAEIMQCVG